MLIVVPRPLEVDFSTNDFLPLYTKTIADLGPKTKITPLQYKSGYFLLGTKLSPAKKGDDCVIQLRAQFKADPLKSKDNYTMLVFVRSEETFSV